MEHTKLVTPGELEDFADRRDSEPVIPELVAHLIRLSVADLALCRIPYGDAIGLPGLDGMVQTEAGFRQFVPKQTSYWEIGRNADAQTKATSEFRKRTADTSLANRANITFVFVTPRSRDWDYKSQMKWIRRRQKFGWKEIKVIDGVQLSEWLRDFPAIGKWLLQRIGLVKSQTGFQTPAEHWSNLAQLNNPSLPPSIFLDGRDNALQQLHKLFRHETQQLILSVVSENDTEDFISAFLESLDENTRLAYSSRCLFVSDAEAWLTFSNLRFSHVLVASPRLDLSESNEQLHLAALSRGHGIVFSISGAWSHGDEKIVPIMSPSRNTLERIFIENGLSRERAAELASAGAQSLSALKRYLRGLGGLPPYATWENARLLSQASLIGKWKGDNAADNEAIELLLGKSYGGWIEMARAETLRADTPLIQRNEVWKVLSRGEAWIALGPRVTNDDLDRFQLVALRILSEIDPQFELPQDEQYLASFHGKVFSHSRSIRQGIVESLALLGTKGNALSSTSQGKAERTAQKVVWELLHKADWMLWASLNDELPLLAEAAPDEFLDSVEAAVVGQADSPFVDVFRREENSGAFGGTTYMSGLLWALETLAWHPDYLGRVTILLGDIASIDPGGRWANRPLNSLIDIFLPWHIQTLADTTQRRIALESLAREHPEVAWAVLLKLLPAFHGVTSGTRKPVWRPYIPQGWKETTTESQFWEQVQIYAEMCTRMATQQLDKLSQIIDRIADLPEPAYSEVLKHLSSPTVTSLQETDRIPLWEALQDIILKHRKFATAQWAMPEEQIKKIEVVANKLAPSSVELLNRRLFTERDFALYDDNDDFELARQKLDKRRKDLICSILEKDGVQGVIRFAEQVESSRKVGDALGAIEGPDVDVILLPSYLKQGDRWIQLLIGSFIERRYWTQKYAWVDQQLKRNWQKEEILDFLLLLPSEPEIWRRAEESLGNDINRYWIRVQINPWVLEPDGLLKAAENLTANGQPGSAVECFYLLSHKKIPIPMPLASAALLGAIKSDEQQTRIDQYHVIEVIKWLQNSAPIDSEDLFKIEWAYLPLLNRLQGGEPKTLEHNLASSPAFFSEIISLVFRSDKEDKDSKLEISDTQKRVAQNAYSLLHGWRILPGFKEDGTFDGDKFAMWLDEVKTLCTKTGHFRIAMDQLGQALAYSPPDPDGLWIHKSIAAALDKKDVPDMRRAFTTGLFNKRGVHGFSKGKQEMAISEQYRLQARALAEQGFIRVADAVRTLADQYEQDANREMQRDIFED